MSKGETQETTPTPEQIAQQFELAKLDYARLGTQEQRLMDKRGEHWTKFFSITGIPGAAAGVFGPASAIYLLALVPFFITCISFEMKHDEQVLRYDVRKQMKLVAAMWGFANFESNFSPESEHQQGRWWHGYYKHGRAAAYLSAEIIATVILCWSFPYGAVLGIPLNIPLTVLNVFFIIATAWCMV